MERLVKDCAKFLRDDVNKCLVILSRNQTIGEDAETLVNPQTRHRMLRVVLVTMSSQQTLKHLRQERQGVSIRTLFRVRNRG